MAGFGNVVSLVVVAGHDGDGLGQGFQPGGELQRIVIPEVVLRLAPQGREGEVGIGGGNRLAESLAAFVRPDDIARPVECEMPESLADEVFGTHFPGKHVRAGNVRDAIEAFLEILRDGNDSVPGEEFDAVRIVKLPDDGIGVHFPGPLDHGFDSELVADRKRQTAQAPGLFHVLGIACDPQEQTTGISLGEVGQEDDSGHCCCRMWGKIIFFFREIHPFGPKINTPATPFSHGSRIRGSIRAICAM